MIYLLVFALIILGVSLGINDFPLLGFIIVICGVTIPFLYDPIKKLIDKLKK